MASDTRWKAGVRDTRTGKRVSGPYRMGGKVIVAAALSPDGRFVAISTWQKPVSDLEALVSTS
jgi:hypothetical protein